MSPLIQKLDEFKTWNTFPHRHQNPSQCNIHQHCLTWRDPWNLLLIHLADESTVGQQQSWFDRILETCCPSPCWRNHFHMMAYYLTWHDLLLFLDSTFWRDLFLICNFRKQEYLLDLPDHCYAHLAEDSSYLVSQALYNCTIWLKALLSIWEKVSIWN